MLWVKTILEPTAGYIFAWTGLEGCFSLWLKNGKNKNGSVGLGTERIEMEMAYDQKLICADMGMFFSDLV